MKRLIIITLLLCNILHAGDNDFLIRRQTKIRTLNDNIVTGTVLPNFYGESFIGVNANRFTKGYIDSIVTSRLEVDTLIFSGQQRFNSIVVDSMPAWYQLDHGDINANMLDDSLSGVYKAAGLEKLFSIEQMQHNSKRGGIFLRGDDAGNGHSRWNILYRYIRAGLPFTWAVEGENANADPTNYIIRTLQSTGLLYLADHTVDGVAYYASDGPSVTTDSSGVVYVSGDTAFFETTLRDTTNYSASTDESAPGSIEADDKFITTSNGAFSALNTSEYYYLWLSQDGTNIDTLRVKEVKNGNASDPDTLILRDMYRQPVTLTTEASATYTLCTYLVELMTVDGMDRQMKASLHNFHKAGVARPYFFIESGIAGPAVLRDTLYLAGLRNNYSGGAIYDDVSSLTYNIVEDRDKLPFGFQWNLSFSLEDSTFQQCKDEIASAIARNYVISLHSHFGDDLARVDSLIDWIKEKNIPCYNAKNWSDILFKSHADPDVNIIPDLTTDIDDNSLPDGWSNIDTYASSGGLYEDQEYCFTRDESGTIVTVDTLGGIEKGYNEFSVWVKGASDDSITVQFDPSGSGDTQTLKFPAENATWTRFSEDNSTNGTTTLIFKNDDEFVDITFSVSDYSSGTVSIGGIELRKKRW